MPAIILIRGAGDLASGVALRLYRVGLRVILTEIEQPLAVRRQVSFAEAIYQGQFAVEGVTARRLKDPADTLNILMTLSKGQIPIVVDPQAEAITHLHPTVVVDARMLKRRVELDPRRTPLIIGLGPGFEAPVNCHAVVETQRGHFLGRVIWKGEAETDSGLPDAVSGQRGERVLRAPADGVFQAQVEIGTLVAAGQVVAEVEGQPIQAPFEGVVRGLLHPGLTVQAGIKVGDIDPRLDPRLAYLVSDKAVAVGGGVLEAILTRTDLRPHLWT